MAKAQATIDATPGLHVRPHVRIACFQGMCQSTCRLDATMCEVVCLPEHTSCHVCIQNECQNTCQASFQNMCGSQCQNNDQTILQKQTTGCFRTYTSLHVRMRAKITAIVTCRNACQVDMSEHTAGQHVRTHAVDHKTSEVICHDSLSLRACY